MKIRKRSEVLCVSTKQVVASFTEPASNLHLSHFPDVQELGGCRCGLYSLAFALHLAQYVGNSSMSIEYNKAQFRSHFLAKEGCPHSAVMKNHGKLLLRKFKYNTCAAFHTQGQHDTMLRVYGTVPL